MSGAPEGLLHQRIADARALIDEGVGMASGLSPGEAGDVAFALVGLTRVMAAIAVCSLADLEYQAAMVVDARDEKAADWRYLRGAGLNSLGEEE